MIKIHQLITLSIMFSTLAGCVTQNYENNAENPVVENSSTNSDIAHTRISLGMGYLNMGNTTQAKINLEKAKRFAPNLTQVYTAFAHYYDVVEEPEQAIEAFEKALSLDSENADTLNNYGVFLCKQKRYKESEAKMLKAIAVPSYVLVSKSYENLALCQLKANEFKKAEMYLAKSIAHSPSSASSLLQMLRLQYAMGNYEEAQTYLRRYEKSTRRFAPNALALAFKVYEKMNNRRVAKNYAGMLVKMFPNSFESKQYILNGLRHIEADDLSEAYIKAGGEDKGKPKKRVMVLSPNKKSGISLSSKVNEVSLPKVQEINSTEVTTLENTPQNEATETKPEVTSLVEGSKENTTVNKETLQSEEAKITVPKKTKKILDENKVETTEAGSSLDDSGNKMLTLPIHVIVKGDSLFSISQRYNIKMHYIERWNSFKRNKILKIGDVIYLADPKKVLKSK